MLKKNNKNYKSITQISLIAVSVIFFILLGFNSEAKAADYYCDSCSDCQDKIAVAGNGDVIYLTQDIINHSGTCLEFNNKTGITFDCDNGLAGQYVIDGIGGDYGIYFSNNSDNNTVRNCYITQFGSGIYIRDSDNMILNNVLVGYNNSYGIYFYNSNSNTLTDITANNNSTGIYFSNLSSSNALTDIITDNNSSNGISFSRGGTGNNLTNLIANNNNYGIYLNGNSSNYFSNNTLDNISVANNNRGIYFYYYSDANDLSDIKAMNNQYGIYFYRYCDNNNIFNNVIKWNTTDDVYIYNSTNIGNTFYNNQFISKNEIYDNGNSTVWDQGGVGNHWDAFDKEDDGCFDTTPSDGYCDSAYQIDADSVDNHPKHIGSITAHYCNSCVDCNEKIASSTAGDTVYLNNNINDTVGHCLDLSGLQNLTFDCQGFAVDSDGNGGNGFYLENSSGNGSHTIKNCFISDFDIGVYILDSNQNTVINNTIKQNINDITISNSSDNTFYSNELLSRNKISDTTANNTNWDNGADAGNHWEGYDETGEGCNDTTPENSICDDGYEIITIGPPPRPTDNFAQYVGYDPFSCNSCEDCNAKIAAANSGDTITLTNNIMNYAGTCIEFDNKSGITFDCNNYVIDGIGGDYYGVYVHGSGGDENNTIKNCYVTQFKYGVYINNSSFNTLDGVIANYNNYGIYINNSSSNFLTNVIANNNSSYYGLYFFFSNFNVLTNITANNNGGGYNSIGGGFYFSSSNSNTLTNITANSNQGYSSNKGYGIYFISSISNTLINITVHYNDEGIYFTNSGDNTIKDSTEIKFNPVNINIESDNGTGNKFYSNDFISKRKITDNSALTQWDDGVGAGNLWQSYDSGDEGCIDGNSDLVCDAFYIVNDVLGTQDNFPEWKKINDDEYHCADCASCSNAIANALYGDKVILDNHIFGASGNCIDFGEYREGITFDGSDYIINGSGSGSGIYLYNYCEDNTVKNLTVTGFSIGAHLRNSKFNNLLDITANYDNRGIFLEDNSNSNNLTNVITGNNSDGVYIHGSSLNILTYANLTDSGYGIHTQWSGNNTITFSTIKLNSTDVYIYSGDANNIFYNNEFVSKEKIQDDGSGTMWDNGEDTGNWWEAYDTDGKGCFDGGADPDPDGVTPISNPVAGDNLCDNHYEIKTGVFDEYPEYKGGAAVIHTCSTCEECNEKIVQASYGDTVQLDQNIFGVPETCVEFNFKQGITFDCQDHTIVGQSGNDGFGIYIHGNSQNDYNTAKNCTVSKFKYGVYVYRSYTNTLDNIISYNNRVPGYSMGYGFYIRESDLGALIDLTAYDNLTAGIYFTGSDSNELSNIKVNNNGTGIYFNYSDNNIITASTGIRLNPTNIYIRDGSDHNIFYDNQFISKERMGDNDSDTHWNKWDSIGGDQQPGNYWESYDTVEEGCADDGFGYCFVRGNNKINSRHK